MKDLSGLTPKQKQLALRKRHLASFRNFLSLKGTGSAIDDFLDMNVWELRNYIQSMWLPMMKWGNYGEVWCVDHIIGLKYFDAFSRKEMQLCWNHYNLIPAYLGDNHAKGYAPEISEKMLLLLPPTEITVQRLLAKARKHILEFNVYYERN